MDRQPSVLPPAYSALRAEGAVLRVRLSQVGPAIAGLDELIEDIRYWQRRAAWAVVSRNPHQAADFHLAAGRFQSPIGPWQPSTGWQDRLDAGIRSWLAAIESVSRPRQTQPVRPGLVAQPS